MDTASSSWRKIDLGPSFEQEARLEQLILQYENAINAQTNTKHAIFIRHENEHSLHCVCIAYLSPHTAEALSIVDALNCAAPHRSGLSKLIGPESAWQLINPQIETE